MSAEIKKILEEIKKQGREVLTYEESRKIIDLAGLPLNKIALATNTEESIEKAREVGYPIALKIVSEDVIHKSDAGGVKVGIKSDEELKKSYEEMMVNIKKHYPSAKVEGVKLKEKNSLKVLEVFLK
ncbi:Peptidyl-lysine N-acetyltransferase Pat [subsurface metagenome]